jgi:hypothetical protein
MALGAQSRDVRRLFLRQGLTLIVAGITIGVGAAALVTPVTSALLSGVSPMDPATFSAASIALAGVTLLGTYLPARRATRAQPIIALQSKTVVHSPGDADTADGAGVRIEPSLTDQRAHHLLIGLDRPEILDDVQLWATQHAVVG